jgi:hypothetical protein
MPPWRAVSRITKDYMDLAGRVMHEAITEEQLSKLSALTHRDVGNAVNAGAFLLPVVCIKLRFINAKTSPYDPQGCGKCRNERDVFLSTYMDVGSAEMKGMFFCRPTGM